MFSYPRMVQTEYHQKSACDRTRRRRYFLLAPLCRRSLATAPTKSPRRGKAAPQRAAKQFVPQPHVVSADYVSLAKDDDAWFHAGRSVTQRRKQTNSQSSVAYFPDCWLPRPGYTLVRANCSFACLTCFLMSFCSASICRCISSVMDGSSSSGLSRDLNGRVRATMAPTPPGQ